MENASKALLMAGGTLIAIIIIAALVKTMNVIGNFQKSNLTEEEQNQLVKFNEQYTKYLGSYVYGTDVITIINKSLDNKSHTITVELEFIQEYNYSTYTINSGDTMTIIYPITDARINDFVEAIAKDDFKNRAFKCTRINYDGFGRVNFIRLEEKNW